SSARARSARAARAARIPARNAKSLPPPAPGAARHQPPPPPRRPWPAGRHRRRQPATGGGPACPPRPPPTADHPSGARPRTSVPHTTAGLIVEHNLTAKFLKCVAEWLKVESSAGVAAVTYVRCRARTVVRATLGQGGFK